MPPLLSSVIEDIGFGWAQIKLTLMGGSVWAADGAELLILGSITRAVREEWDLTPFQRGFVVSVVFIGVLLGNFLSGTLGDMYGRRLPIIISYVGVFAFSITSVLAWNFTSLTIMRLFVGMAFGVGQPAWNAFGSEISPDKYRLLMNGIGQSLFSLGEIYAATLIYIDNPRMKYLDWRWLVIMGSIPSLILVCLAYFFLPESPFFLAANDKKEDAREVLQALGQANGYSNAQTDFQVIAQNSNDETWSEKLTVILGPHLLFSTMVVAFSTFNLNFLFYGGLYAFPQVLPDMELAVSPAMNLLVGALSEIPGLYLGVFLGHYYNRKDSMQLFCIGMIVSLSIFVYGAQESSQNEIIVQTGFILSKMVLCLGFIIVYVYCTEIYPTSCRTTGSALCLASGRVGALVCPIVYEQLATMTGSFSSFFFVMIGFCVINMALIFCLPYETSGKSLPEDLEATALLRGNSRRGSSLSSWTDKPE